MSGGSCGLDVFCTNPAQSDWKSATVIALDDKMPRCTGKICGRDPCSRSTVLPNCLRANKLVK